MPELPEVEFARRSLERWLEGRDIERAVIPKSRITRNHTLSISGRVESVQRKGKWLKIELSEGALFSHLGMTGKWIRRDPGSPDEKFQKARLEVDGHSVIYRDPRLFGRLVVADHLPEWDALGPDPLGDGLDATEIAARLKKISRSIKETLLDQRLFAGVGNIQAAEALWRAKINPKRKSSSLTQKEIGALIRGIQDSIEYTLSQEDGPEIEYVEEGGENPFKVYARETLPGLRCKTQLKRIEQGGRGTVYCPKCQGR
jgi:formamidopyrimidine-DNA glycosylase